MLFSRSIDLLKANSLHYEQLQPALCLAFQVVWEGQSVSMLDSQPQDYEDARQLLIELSRMDSRLSKPVKRKFWRAFLKENGPKAAEELTPDERIRRINALIKSKKGYGHFSQDREELVAFIESFEKNPPVFTESLVMSASRIEYWQSQGVITRSIPCDVIQQKPCYAGAQEKMRRKKKFSED